MSQPLSFDHFSTLLSHAAAALAAAGIVVYTRVIASGCLRFEAVALDGRRFWGSPPLNLPLDPVLALLLLVLQGHRALDASPEEWPRRAFVATEAGNAPFAADDAAAFDEDLAMCKAVLEFLGRPLFQTLATIGSSLLQVPKV